MRNFLLLICWLPIAVIADDAPRARDLGIPFDGTPGPLNAITDVSGVTVGHSTVIEDYENGSAARTGVTAILPRGKESIMLPVFGGTAVLNGAGEMTGTIWVEASGFLEGPVMITTTQSVGMVFEETIKWRVNHADRDVTGYAWSDPVVAETWGGRLNDEDGFHVRPEHVVEAIETAKSGPVAEGNVGGGTGMVCYQFKCGIGTASRVVATVDGEFTVGVLVQANYGWRDILQIAGAPVGREIPVAKVADIRPPMDDEMGSIIVVIATDAPLLPHQLKRVATRAGLGIARVGGMASNGSGDIFIAFSTANPQELRAGTNLSVRMLGNEHVTPVFSGAVLATEEAIVNALVAARTMTGFEGRTIEAIDHEALRSALRKYNRLQGSE
ncbi:MAG: P1 family peptidase [Proteobacteria bacterium]|nr:P1 family peptidase [Pseudomonadota bacterium]TDJ35523.1 MAG: S58 family peptidase [Gammaproteobacteria bacterium]